MKENLISESVLCSLIKTQPLKSTRVTINLVEEQLLHRNCLR